MQWQADYEDKFFMYNIVLRPERSMLGLVLHEHIFIYHYNVVE